MRASHPSGRACPGLAGPSGRARATYGLPLRVTGGCRAPERKRQHRPRKLTLRHFISKISSVPLDDRPSACRTVAIGRRPKPLCGRPPPRKDLFQPGRVWSIAIMCPALVCGHVDRGPRWVTRIGSQTSRRGLRPKGFPGVFRSSVRPIAILLLSLQAPGQNAVSELLDRKRPAIKLTAYHHGPERPSHLVGQRDGRKLFRLTR
jgi:hypothetical protein